MHYRAEERIPEAVFGLAFVHESGVTVAGPNSGASLPSMPLERGEGHVDFSVPTLVLQPGTFDITSAIVHQGHVFDYADRAFNLRVRGAGTDEAGLVRMIGEWTPAVPDGPTGSARRQRVPR
jgi:ABC-2 type transport system ATP-binding protein/lipopolysaccharide transport system ATP-binding protein